MTDSEHRVYLQGGPLDGSTIVLRLGVMEFQKAYTVCEFLVYKRTDEINELDMTVFDYDGVVAIEPTYIPRSE